MKIDFEEYLVEQWQNEVSGTQMDCLDDDMPDIFNKWLMNLEPDDFIKYANQYAIELSINNKLNEIYQNAVVKNKEK